MAAKKKKFDLSISGNIKSAAKNLATFKAPGRAPYTSRAGGGLHHLTKGGLRPMDLRRQHERGAGGRASDVSYVKKGKHYYREGTSPSGVHATGKVAYAKQGGKYVRVARRPVRKAGLKTKVPSRKT